ncbi:hypothetical protein DFN06_003426 [Clostridium beijerinckii]|nr:hypothetical protein [Clostridium beijerinckii]NYB96506.1 hypothetical protein [Clostridium beijerinckii]
MDGCEDFKRFFKGLTDRPKKGGSLSKLATL